MNRHSAALPAAAPLAEAMTTPSHPFRLRACVSLVVALCFLVLVVSGAILFLAPPGRVANWTEWRIAWLTKHEWGDLHTVFAALFLLGGLLHVWFNWRPLLSYFRSRAAKGRGMRWEWVAALLLCLLVFAGIRAEVPPLATLLDWSEGLKQSWEQPAQRAPIPHAEDLTLGALCEQVGVPLATAQERLAAAAVHGIAAEPRRASTSNWRSSGSTPRRSTPRLTTRCATSPRGAGTTAPVRSSTRSAASSQGRRAGGHWIPVCGIPPWLRPSSEVARCIGVRLPRAARGSSR